MQNKSLFGLCLGFLLICQAPSNAAVTISPGLDGAGFRISLVAPFTDFDPGFGLGVHLDVGLLEWLHFYPNFEYCYAGRSYHPNYYPFFNTYWEESHWLNEFTLNGDLRFYPPLPFNPVRPYAGGGFAFVLSREDWKYQNNVPPYDIRYDNYTSPGLGFNFLLGCDIPIGSLISFVELKFKVGSAFNLFKLTGGLTFPLSRSLLHRR
jgi:hypothetical protein